jgi:hypothetical protein
MYGWKHKLLILESDKVNEPARADQLTKQELGGVVLLVGSSLFDQMN